VTEACQDERRCRIERMGAFICGNRAFDAPRAQQQVAETVLDGGILRRACGRTPHQFQRIRLAAGPFGDQRQKMQRARMVRVRRQDAPAGALGLA
jgi:hypothetical protein